MAALGVSPSGPPRGPPGHPAAPAGVWEWDDNERGIVLLSQESAPRPPARGVSRLTVARAARGGAGCLLANLDVTFQDVVDTLDQIRFQRHWRRRTLPGQPDVVTLRDVKDVVLFQVQPELPADFLQLFHTAAVDRFLRTLILYCSYLIETSEWISFKLSVSEQRIIEPGLRAGQRRLQRNLVALRVLLARDYHTLLLGEGTAGRRSFHHMSNGDESWSQRDARLWELLLRLSARVAFVALRSRCLKLIDAEVGRLFRSEPFNLSARRQQAAGTAATDTTPWVWWEADPGCPQSPHARRAQQLRDEVLYGAADNKCRRLFTRSPATLELIGRDGLEPHWTLLALGRMPVPSLAKSLRCVEAAYTLNEEELVQRQSSFLGILGMPRNNLDLMLNIKDKEKLLSNPASLVSSGQQCSTLFRAEEEGSPTIELDPITFPFPED